MSDGLGAADLEQAQLQCFKSIDAPVAPASRGARVFGKRRRAAGDP